METKLIELTDGSKLGIKVNFATLYYMQKMHIDKMMDKELTDDDKMDLAAKLLYVILRSNGKEVTLDEAMMLVPMGTEEISDMFEEFKDRLEIYKKKEAARKQMKTMQ